MKKSYLDIVRIYKLRNQLLHEVTIKQDVENVIDNFNILKINYMH